tara:strand:- start:485 stop:919 length:435 start_codon:yes stop_codon:yes gene_type:complete
MNIQYPNLLLKNNNHNISNLYSKDICKVSVNYIIYDKKKKNILHFGMNRPCGCNYHKPTIHAEELAINYCRHSNNRNLEIYIWRWGIKGNIKKTDCCISCTKLAEKYGYQNKIFTFDENNEKRNAIISNPELSLAYKIKYNLNH